MRRIGPLITRVDVLRDAAEETIQKPPDTAHDITERLAQTKNTFLVVRPLVVLLVPLVQLPSVVDVCESARSGACTWAHPSVKDWARRSLVPSMGMLLLG